MASLNDLHALVRDHISPVPPKAIINSAILRAAREFCKKTGAYRDELSFVTIADESYAEIDLPEGAQIFQLLEDGVREQNSNYFLTQAKDFLKVRNVDITDKPKYIRINGGSTAELSPIPDAAYTFSASAMLMPTLTATTIDDDLFNDWGEYLAFGAVYYLATQSMQPWGDRNQAELMNIEFIRGIREAKGIMFFGVGNESATIVGNGFI